VVVLALPIAVLEVGAGAVTVRSGATAPVTQRRGTVRAARQAAVRCRAVAGHGLPR
jgi:hypothetical protein